MESMSYNKETPPSETTSSIKDVTDVIGNFGKWQWGICFVVFLVKLIGPFHNLNAVFMVPKVPFWCAEGWANRSLVANDSSIFGKKSDQCHISVTDESNTTHLQDCNHWEYDHTTFKSTLTEKFNLVCDKSWLNSLTGSVYMVGFLIACVFLGHLADKIGRRPVLFIGMFSLLFADCLSLYSPNYIVFVICQFFTGFGRTGVLNASYILLLEVVGIEYRSVVGIGVAAGFNIGYMIFPGVAFLLEGDWFYIQTVTTCLAAFLAAIFWIIPESPRWLLLNNRPELAEKVMTKVAKVNGIKIANPQAAVEHLTKAIKKNDSADGKGKINIFELLKTPNMRKKTCVLFYLWFASSFVYYGLSFNVQNIGGNIYLNFFIFGAAELPGTLFAIWGLRYIGRKKTFMIAMFTAAAACVGIVPLTNHTGLLWLRITLATIGKAMVQASFETVYVYTVELIPTKLRSVGMTSCSLWARVGSIIAPFMKELGEGNNFMIPMGLFGGLAASSSLLTILLPETKDCPLPETLEQGEMFAKASKAEITENTFPTVFPSYKMNDTSK